MLPVEGENQMMPDFIVIGAARSGTTWIAEFLGAHLEVYIPLKKDCAFLTITTTRAGKLARIFSLIVANQRQSLKLTLPVHSTTEFLSK